MKQSKHCKNTDSECIMIKT